MALLRESLVPLIVAALGVAPIAPRSVVAQERAPQQFEAILHAMDEQAAQQVHLECDDWGWDPLDSGHVISLCIGEERNTRVRVFRTKTGQLIAVTREVGLPRADALSMLDSVRDSLSNSLGQPDSCRQYNYGMKRSYLWHSGSYSVLLALFDPSGQPIGHGKYADESLGIQAVRSTLRLDCYNWIPGRLK